MPVEKGGVHTIKCFGFRTRQRSPVAGRVSLPRRSVRPLGWRGSNSFLWQSSTHSG